MHFDLFNEDFLLPLVVFSFFAFVFKTLLNYMERRQMIKEKVDVNFIKPEKNTIVDVPPVYSSLKYGLLFLALSLGLFFGEMQGGDEYNPLPFFIYTLMFGGIGLLVNFGILKLMGKKKEE
ncbi:MAG: hypothetical protein MI784_14245 [Cytophagales bacterium]|nr:hypothetical protein [Cytophagales bacterium]